MGVPCATVGQQVSRLSGAKDALLHPSPHAVTGLTTTACEGVEAPQLLPPPWKPRVEDQYESSCEALFHECYELLIKVNVIGS